MRWKTSQTWIHTFPDFNNPESYVPVRRRRAEHPDKWLISGLPGFAFNIARKMRRLEQYLMNLLLKRDRIIQLHDRIDNLLENAIRNYADAGADAAMFPEDWGTQNGPMISVDLYRCHLRPIHQQFIDLATTYNVPAIVHSCGSSTWAYPDLIEMGVRVIDTLQPEAKDMAPAYLKSTYGDRLAFHGTISTAGAVKYGSVDDTRSDLEQTVEAMKPGSGYALAPTHQLQDNSLTENVVALYETAIACGQYSLGSARDTLPLLDPHTHPRVLFLRA